jgi:hypothetical protein
MDTMRFFGVVKKEMGLFCFALKLHAPACNPVLNKSNICKQMSI